MFAVTSKGFISLSTSPPANTLSEYFPVYVLVIPVTSSRTLNTG